MTRTSLALLASVPLLLACPKRAVLPDPKIPHRVARDATVEVWVRAPDGKMTRQTVKVAEGWWVASPCVVEP